MGSRGGRLELAQGHCTMRPARSLRQGAIEAEGQHERRKQQHEQANTDKAEHPHVTGPFPALSHDAIIRRARAGV